MAKYFTNSNHKSSFLYWTLLFFLSFLFIDFAAASTTNGTILSANKSAWSSNAGWINFGAANGNVHITDSAVTGYAWSDVYGWINLSPANGGVRNTTAGVLSGNAWSEKLGWINFTGVFINTYGSFTGQATGDNIGTLNFNCPVCRIGTDWRPSAGTPASDGGFPPNYFPPAPSITPPAGPITTPEVPPTAITPPPTEKPPGIVETVIKKITTIVSQLPAKIPTVPIAQYLDRLNQLLPNLFGPPPAMPKMPIETFVARLTPPAMTGRWSYIDPKKINRFVFAPLPTEFLALEKNFPAVKNLFSKIGVQNLKDLSKLELASLHLPGLSETAGRDYQNTPKNVIFASTAGQLVDYKVALSLTKRGQPEQKISTISGKPLHLTVRPDNPVKAVKGYLVFRSRTPRVGTEINFEQILASIFAEPVFAYPLDQPIPIEEKLVLNEFEYVDQNHDGIYTADIYSPLSSGEYEIITVMDYVDPDLGSKQIRLITVVDPEGYVYQNVGNNEMRLANVSVTLYSLNQTTNKYEVWPAKDFGQENPQLTDVRGTYSFLVPVGKYYLAAKTNGYADYQSEQFTVQEGSGVHMNIELKTRYGWLQNIDWKTVLLIIVTIFLLFNFYKDKKRKV